MRRWHLLTVEYPPACGGVADYTRHLARALAAAGDEVAVWVPTGSGPERDEVDAGVHIRILPDRFGAESRRMLGDAWQAAPGIVLLQYVPMAIGTGRTNLRFCRWLLAQRRRGVDVRVMFHEPYFYFTLRRPWLNVVALSHRAMAATLVRASDPIYVSTETWVRYLSPYGTLRDVQVLPIPATVSSSASHDAISNFRTAMGAAPGDAVIGHFGTYGDHVVGELLPAIETIVRRLPSVRIALLGSGSDRFLKRLRSRVPAAHVYASGRLAPSEVASALRACDLVVQPYPDGVTTRRTSVMAALVNSVPVVTTDGALTESIWKTSGGVSLVPAGRPAALEAAAVALALDTDVRGALAIRGRWLYDQHFSMERTIASLRAGMPRAEAALPMAL
jgi:glycosyltransferase involved in cell wall biosynthesis